MRIQINEDWRITSDPQNFILEMKRIRGKESKTPGDEYYTAEGFYTNLDNALQGLVRRSVLESDCDSFESLNALLRQLDGSIRDVQECLDARKVIY
jgi:hypothetical protein